MSYLVIGWFFFVFVFVFVFVFCNFWIPEFWRVGNLELREHGNFKMFLDRQLTTLRQHRVTNCYEEINVKIATVKETSLTDMTSAEKIKV